MIVMTTSMASEVSSNRTSAQFEWLAQLPSAWTCVSGRFGVHFFQGELSVSDMDRLEAVGERWQRGNKGPRVEMVVILPSRARLSGDERQRMSRLMRHGEADRVAAATVILADGVSGSLQRSLLTGLLLVTPAPHPVKVCGKLDEALLFLSPYLQKLGGQPNLGELVSAVNALYAAFRDRPTAG